jgi:hypothetical protein
MTEIRSVYEYYTDPENIKKTCPSDIVKESEDISGTKNEEGTEMKSKRRVYGSGSTNEIRSYTERRKQETCHKAN